MADEWVREAPATGSVIASSNRLIQIMSAADAQKNNLRWAKAAVDDAKLAVRGGGSSNKLKDEAMSIGGVAICVWLMRRDSDRKSVGKSGVARIREIADAGRQHGCGNCGELSAMAFIFLFDRRIPVTLDWISIQGGDHAFVLLDREPGDVADPSSWGPRCVVCDPWKDRVTSGASIERFGGATYTPAPGDNRLYTPNPQSYASVYREEA